MDREKKKKTAAVSAVLAYMRTMEELAVMQEPGELGAAAPAVSGRPAPVGCWGHSGRQYQMQLRNLMQMKSFHGSRLR